MIKPISLSMVCLGFNAIVKIWNKRKIEKQPKPPLPRPFGPIGTPSARARAPSLPLPGGANLSAPTSPATRTPSLCVAGPTHQRRVVSLCAPVHLRHGPTLSAPSSPQPPLTLPTHACREARSRHAPHPQLFLSPTCTRPLSSVSFIRFQPLSRTAAAAARARR